MTFAGLVAGGLLLAASAAPPAFERAIGVTVPGRAAVALDREVYEGARADLGDLRVVDDGGSFVPYWLERGEGNMVARREAVIRNRGFVRGRSATATLDFGGPVLKRELVIVSSGDSFRRRVAVEGSADSQSWVTLTDGAYVFAVSGPEAARYERVPLPENDHRYLRVTLFRDADDPATIEIKDAWVPVAPRAIREEALTPAMNRAEDAERHETVLTLDLRARHQPFVGLVVEVEDRRFFRGVVVEARRDPPPPRRGESPRPIEWVRLVEGPLYRYPEGEQTREALRLDVSGRERALRLRIRNRDDRPLSIRGVRVAVPVERVVFEAAPGRRYRLTYGSPDLPAPAYDLGRTIGEPRVWAAAASAVPLGPLVRMPSASAPLPWTERHPALFWAGLLVVVAGLAAVTWRALKAA